MGITVNGTRSDARDSTWERRGRVPRESRHRRQCRQRREDGRMEDRGKDRGTGTGQRDNQYPRRHSQDPVDTTNAKITMSGSMTSGLKDVGHTVQQVGGMLRGM